MNARIGDLGTTGRTIGRGLVISALAVGVLLGSMSEQALAASPAPKAVAVKADGAPHGFKSVDEAVKAGVLDRKVLDRLAAKGRVDTIVVFDGSAVRANASVEAGNGKDRGQRAAAALKAGHKANKDRAFHGVKGATVLDPLETLSLASVRFTGTAALLKVANDKDVTGIQVPSTYSPQIDQSRGVIRQPQAAAIGARGAGTTIAILDTGVDWTTGYFGTCPTVPATGCRVLESLDFAPNDGLLDDDDHGTNVAGIAAAIAPGANILAYDVFEKAFSLDTFSYENTADDAVVVRAINRAVSLRYADNVRAINLSLGGSGDDARWTTTCPTIDGQVNLYAQAFADARFVGIVPVVAAGNDATMTNGQFGPGLAAPACTPGAVSVGATYDAAVGAQSWVDCTDSTTALDKVTCFSMSGPNLTILAPGACIVAAGVGADYDCYGGTSQAAPHVAGAAAVLAAVRPTASVTDITNALTSTGKLIADPRPGAATKPRLDLYAAVAAISAPVDQTKPVFATAPSQAIAAGWTLATNGVTAVTFEWHATDASGIARYNVSLRANGGTWYDYTSSLASATAESLTFNLNPGVTYELAVIAQDKAGIWSDWRYGVPVTPGVTAENGIGVAYYGGGWTRVTNTSAVGGAYTTGATTNAYARYTFTGRNVAWVGTSASNRGVARVYLDGTLVKTIDLNGALAYRKVQFSQAVDPTRSHTLDVQVAGTAGRPTIDIDAFVVLR